MLKPRQNVIVSTVEPSGADRQKVWLQKGKNLFDANSLFTGYRIGSDGLLFAHDNYSATDFIPVNPNTNYIANWSVITLECICYYDETKTFISRNTSENPFTTPHNCKYIRASRLTTNTITAQIEQGSRATDYEEYIEHKMYVLNDNNVYEEFMKKEENVDSSKILHHGETLNNLLNKGTFKEYNGNLSGNTTYDINLSLGQFSIVIVTLIQGFNAEIVGAFTANYTGYFFTQFLKQTIASTFLDKIERRDYFLRLTVKNTSNIQYKIKVLTL